MVTESSVPLYELVPLISGLLILWTVAYGFIGLMVAFERHWPKWEKPPERWIIYPVLAMTPWMGTMMLFKEPQAVNVGGAIIAVVFVLLVTVPSYLATPFMIKVIIKRILRRYCGE